MTYASATSVSVENTKAEIERTVTRYGASKFFSGWDHEQAVIGFNMAERFVQFKLPLPARDGFWKTKSGQTRTSRAQVEKAWEQAQRSRWRGLLLCIKAKLESVESGIESFEEAFLSHIMVGDGEGGSTTVGEVMIPQIKVSYEGQQPTLALPMTSGS